MEEAKIWEKNTRSLKKCKEAIEKGCKCPQKGSKNRSFHDQTLGAICGVLLSSSPPHPSTFPTPQSSPIEPSTVTASDRAMLFLLTAVRSNIVSAHSSRRKADTFFLWPRYPLPVFSTLSFSPALLFRLSFSEPPPNTQTHNLSLLATAGWHHVCVCVCGWRDSVLAYISVYVWLECVREKLWHVINALRTSLGTSWLDSPLCAYTHTYSQICTVWMHCPTFLQLSVWLVAFATEAGQLLNSSLLPSATPVTVTGPEAETVALIYYNTAPIPQGMIPNDFNVLWSFTLMPRIRSEYPHSVCWRIF